MRRAIHKRGLGIICFQFLWLICFGSSAWAETPLSSGWKRLDRYLGTFSPLSKAFDPLEEAIPGLRVLGSVREWGDWNTRGHTKFFGPPGPTGRRPLIWNRDYNVQQLETIGELQLRYSPRPGLSLIQTTQVVYDAQYDLYPRLPAHRFKEGIHTTRDPDYIIREAYLDWFPNPSWRFMLGRMQEAWGKMIVPITDIVHGFDVREGGNFEADDFALRRINRTMANITYFTEALGGTNEFKLLWIPEFQGNIYSPLDFGAGSSWNPPTFNPATFLPLRKRLENRPNWDPGDSEAFFRWTHSRENLTFFLMYGYLWDRTPTVWLKSNVRTRTGALQPLLEHSRSHGYGFGLDYAFTLSNLPWVETLPVSISTEHFSMAEMEFTPIGARAARMNSLVARRILGDNHMRRPSYRGAIDFTFGFPDRWTFVLSNVFYYNFGWKTDMSGGFAGANEWSDIFLWALTHPFRFTDDRLSMAITNWHHFAGPAQTDKYGGTKLRVVLTYALSQYLQFRLIGTFFEGRNSTSLKPGEILGAYETWDHYDNIGFELNYEF